MIPDQTTRTLETRVDELLKANEGYRDRAMKADAAKAKAEAVAEAALDAMAALYSADRLPDWDKKFKPASLPEVVVTNRSRAEEDFDGQRRLQARKYGGAHDDKLTKGELARAAAVYVLDHVDGIDAIVKRDLISSLEPWPTENLPRRQALLVAANLLVSEVERMDRRERRDAKLEAENNVKAELARMDLRCNEKKRIAGLPMPRTCTVCGIGPCLERRKAAVHG